jgi:DNA-damage-inducible protein D
MKRGISPKPKQEMGNGKKDKSQPREQRNAMSMRAAKDRLKKTSPTEPTGGGQLDSVQQMGLETTKHRKDAAKILKAKKYTRFEDIKRTRADGSSYWLARELATVLEYTNWQNFAKVIDRAMIACDNSGNSVKECFIKVSKTSAMPHGGTKPLIDYELSRYACYLIVQNGDPRKEVIALGQTYFALQTYRQEITDRFNQLDEDRRRLVVRGERQQWNQLGDFIDEYK